MLAARLEAGQEPVKVVCFGDSVTGVYYHTGGRRAYTKMVEIALSRAYPTAKVTAINAGISGNTTRQGLARIDRDVLSHRPQLVTIMFGLNDLVGTKPEVYASNLVEIIRKSRAVGSEVLLCTPNSVYDSPSRPAKRLEVFCDVVRKVGQEHNVPVADCYRAYQDVRKKNELDWAFLMSDAIHPNMDGHQLIAEEIVRTVSGKQISLDDVGAPTPTIPKMRALLKANQPIKVLAMPPYDKLIGPAIKQAAPNAQVEVTTWNVAGQSLAQIEQASKSVRKGGYSLVLIAVPATAEADSPEQFIKSYSWVLNWSLSFAKQQWDCLALPPSFTSVDLSKEELQRDGWAQRLIGAQDLPVLIRKPGDSSSAESLLADWFKQQLAP
jgi:acyl-CoA thioesterase I